MDMYECKVFDEMFKQTRMHMVFDEMHKLPMHVQYTM